MRIKWNKPALAELGNQLEYIAKDSSIQSDKIQARVFSITDALVDAPNRYPPDKWKQNNNGTFRVFEEDRLRISYRIFRNSIHIIRVRHARQKPLRY